MKELSQKMTYDISQCRFEDDLITWKILHCANKIIRINDAKYHYLNIIISLSNGTMNMQKVESTFFLGIIKQMAPVGTFTNFPRKYIVFSI